MPVDPFEIKRLSRAHPARIGFTIYARAVELFAKMAFSRLLIKPVDERWHCGNDVEQRDTAVTPPQMAALLHFVAVCDRENVEGNIVEIGSFRGVTTAEIAKATKRVVHAVDPYQNYGGAEEDLKVFEGKLKIIPNINHVKETSGRALNIIGREPLCFAFIDAVHDYVNTYFDSVTWWEKIVPGGFLALHDTDARNFAGTRLAAWRMSRRALIVCHIPGLLIVQKV